MKLSVNTETSNLRSLVDIIILMFVKKHRDSDSKNFYISVFSMQYILMSCAFEAFHIKQNIVLIHIDAYAWEKKCNTKYTESVLALAYVILTNKNHSIST